MKTKSRIFLLALATLCLAACEKRELIPENKDSEEGEYMLEIEGLQDTKGSASTVELNLANLAYESSKTINAQLKRKSGTSWVSINDGVNYAWSATSADSKKFSGSGTGTKSCKISALAAGSGTMNVSASISGTTVATKGVPVNVTDSRALSWTNVTTSIESGSVKTATLNSNFSCTATVSSNNGSFVVGTSSTSLGSTVSVDFSSNTTKTIYYKYTGSQETTVKLSANSSGVSEASSNISVKASGPATLKGLTVTPSKRYCYINEYIPVTYTATYTDGTTKTLSYSDVSWDCFCFERGEAPTDDEQAEVRYCNLTSSGFVTSNAESGSLYNLAGGLTGSSYCVYVQVKYTESGKTVGGYLDMTVNVEAIDMEVYASGTDLYKSKPSQSIYFYPKFKLRTGDGSSVYFRDASEAKELVERYGDYGFNLRGSDVPSWVITVDDCLSADYYYKESIDLFVRYPGLSIKYQTVTYNPN